MHRHRAARRITAPLIAAAASLAALLTVSACSQATTARSSRTENVVNVTSTTGSGHQSATIRYETDVDAASVALDVPVSVAWRRASQAYAALKLPVTTMDSAQYLIGARRATVRNRLAGERLSEWFNCGLTPLGTARADSYALFVTILTQVVPATSGSTARTIVSATAEANDSPSGAIQCSSTGELEDRIGRAITAP